jgi:hypothetical protein
MSAEEIPALAAIVGGASIVIFISTTAGNRINSLQDSINKFVETTGEGIIKCSFSNSGNAILETIGDKFFVNKKLSQIDPPQLQTIVAAGFADRTCWAELPKLPSAERPKGQPANTLQLRPRKG